MLAQRLRLCLILLTVSSAARADIYRWDNGQVIPGTEGIEPGPFVNLSNFDLQFADFRDADLSFAIFSGANLADADFSRADLQGAQFVTCGLGGCSNAKVAGAKLEDANVTGGGFWAATDHGLTAEQWYSTASYKNGQFDSTDLSWNQLSGWDLHSLNLRYAGFFGSNLSRADLSSSDLYYANLWLANLTNVDLTDTKLEKATLTSSDMRGARGLQLLPTTHAEHAVLPDGTIDGVDTSLGGEVWIRDYDGDQRPGAEHPPIPIEVSKKFLMPNGNLRLLFENDEWDSTIHFEHGIDVLLGGTLELGFAKGVDPTSQIGRTFQVFDWTGVASTGQFINANSYRWNLSDLYTSGEVTFLGVPEPSSGALILILVACLCLRKSTHSIQAILLAAAIWCFCLAPGIAGTPPPEVSGSAQQWPLPNKDYRNTRADFGTRLSSATINQLEKAWSFPLRVPEPVAFGVAASNPLIVGDAVYFQDLQSNLYVIDMNSGNARWQRQFGQGTFGPNGVAVGWGKVFAAKGDKSFIAVDSQTGSDLWEVNLSRSAGEGITIQPLAYDDTVYLSTVPVSNDGLYIGGATGVIHAIDPDSGAKKWSFDTVASPDIWGNPTVNSGGGAWFSPAIDVERGTMYWGTANPGPFPGTGAFPNGSSRPGDNLYTNSLVALDHASGGLEWYTQVLPHDILDHDVECPPILASVDVNGSPRDIVIGAGKLGRVFAFDRENGEVLWNTAVGKHQNDDVTSIPAGETLEVFPGIFGGVMTPMAYADGVVFVPTVNHHSFYTDSSWDVPFDFSQSGGELSAIDVATGDIIWSKEFDSLALGAATIVNDLVITSTLDGMIYAFERSTGEEMWSYQAPGGINGWPAVSNDTIIIPVGIGEGRNPAQLLALRLPAALQAGDTDSDGDVDLADLNNVRNNLGAAGLGDTNGDQMVDLVDLNNVRNHFGESTPPAVPEPSSSNIAFVLVALLAGPLMRLRRRGEVSTD